MRFRQDVPGWEFVLDQHLLVIRIGCSGTLKHMGCRQPV